MFPKKKVHEASHITICLFLIPCTFAGWQDRSFAPAPEKEGKKRTSGTEKKNRMKGAQKKYLKSHMDMDSRSRAALSESNAFRNSDPCAKSRRANFWRMHAFRWRPGGKRFLPSTSCPESTHPFPLAQRVLPLESGLWLRPEPSMDRPADATSTDADVERASPSLQGEAEVRVLVLVSSVL